ncbi:hypothetical protein Pyrfu_1008 [Pyrolobus fumarii 1A]|uniref:Uncharacterized protein n=1 Tax=Pyrolobus fumarii (strain DSM 11204 / 1A) TaxID=694429 RepID=G0EEQ4_PYRF1|nr:hypothetical protein Pyrfu_1008 [Pyrolobus fumarii 1A]
MRKRDIIVVLAALVMGVYAASAATLWAPVEEMGSTWLGEMRFADTLHATTKGMKYWYERGIGKYTGIPYEQMFCSKCHATCESCHGVRDSNGNVVDFSVKMASNPDTCFACHGRQKKAYLLGKSNPELADVHMLGLGVSCTFCHSSVEVHGMHGDFQYMFDKGGVFDVSCEKCHIYGYAPRPYRFIEEHRVHLDDIACSACHSPTVVTCYNCHLSYSYEKYVETGVPVKKAIPIIGWLPLVRDQRTGKIVPGNFMVVVWTHNGTEAVRVDIAQFFPHIVDERGRTCNDCHGIEAAKQLLESGELRLVWVENGQVKHMNGVIPIVEGTKLVFQTFVWDEASNSFKPFKEVVVTVGPDTLIEATSGLTMEDLEKMAKSPEELQSGTS